VLTQLCSRALALPLPQTRAIRIIAAMMLRFARLPFICLALVLLAAAPAAAQDAPLALDAVLDRAEDFPTLRAIVVARDGQEIAARGYHGHRVADTANIKSASKSVISGLVGVAIDKGLLEGPDQPIAPLFEGDLPADPDPRLFDITVGDLLSMQAGLERTSGQNYGRWVTSPNWVRYALSRPFVADPGPGGPMLYSTGSSHLLSAILTRVSGRSTRALANDWLGALPGFAVGGWEQDPQGVYMGGNQMAMTPRSLLAFGEMYRTGGLAPDGTRVLSQDWIDASWTHRTNSRFTGDEYGYGWFMRTLGGEEVHYGWGYGGQMLYVAPSLGLTVAVVSDENEPSGRTGYRDDLHRMMADIVRAVRDGDPGADF